MASLGNNHLIPPKVHEMYTVLVYIFTWVIDNIKIFNEIRFILVNSIKGQLQWKNHPMFLLDKKL